MRCLTGLWLLWDLRPRGSGACAAEPLPLALSAPYVFLADGGGAAIDGRRPALPSGWHNVSLLGILLTSCSVFLLSLCMSTTDCHRSSYNRVNLQEARAQFVSANRQ